MTSTSSPFEARQVSCIGSKWMAYYKIHGIHFFLGSFDSEAEANYACDNRLDQLNKSLQNSSSNGPIESTINADQNRYYPGRDNFSCTAEQAKNIWDELSSLSQRYLLLKATKSKLINLQVFSCSYQTDALLKSLNEEMIIVGVAKAQLEEALQRCLEDQLILTFN